jgi:hypothetical protein
MNMDRRRKRFAGLAVGATVLTSVAVTGAGPIATGQGQVPTQAPAGTVIGTQRLGNDVVITVNAARDPQAARRATVTLKTVIRNPDGTQQELETMVGSKGEWFFNVVTAPKGLGVLQATSVPVRDRPEKIPFVELSVRLTPNQGYVPFGYEARGGKLIQTTGPQH